MAGAHFWLLVPIATPCTSMIIWYQNRKEAHQITLRKGTLSFSKPEVLSLGSENRRETMLEERGHHNLKEEKKIHQTTSKRTVFLNACKPSMNRWWWSLLATPRVYWISSTFLLSRCCLPALSLCLILWTFCSIFTTPNPDTLLWPQESTPSYCLGRFSYAMVSSWASTLRSLLSLPNDWPEFSLSICLSFMENMIVALSSLLYVQP